MRGTFTFKPVKANLTHDTEWITKMDPYCSFTLGSQKFKSQICKSGGKNPVWSDQIQVPIDTDQQFCYLQLLDQDRLSKDDNIGTATIDLFEIMNNTNRFVSKWYPIFYNNKSAGEILLEIGFSPSGQNFGNQQFVSGTHNISTGLTGQTGHTGLTGQTGYAQSGLGTQGYSQPTTYTTTHVPLSTGQTSGFGTNIGHTGYGGSNIGQTGYVGSNLPLGSHGSVEDPLYGKTVNVKSADAYSHTGYQQSSNLGYGGSNLGQGTNLGYGQGTNLGQQGTGTGFIDNTLGKVGQKIDQTLGYGHGTNLGQQGTNLGYGQGSNLGQQGTNLGYGQGTNLGQQGTNLGQQGTGTGFIDNTLGRVGQKIDQTLGRHNPNVNPTVNPNLNQNLGGQQFTQPGFH